MSIDGMVLSVKVQSCSFSERRSCGRTAGNPIHFSALLGKTGIGNLRVVGIGSRTRWNASWPERVTTLEVRTIFTSSHITSTSRGESIALTLLIRVPKPVEAIRPGRRLHVDELKDP